MIIQSDWHIHSQYSYDASNPLDEIGSKAKDQGLVGVGITDHVNFNDEKFITDLKNSAKGVTKAQKQYPFMVLGVELTPIALPEFEHIAKTKTREGYVPPLQSSPYGIELALSKQELIDLGVRYAIGAAHWRVDCPPSSGMDCDLQACLKEWHRLQLWLACDERVTILGHPWYHGKGLWYEDFSIIPKSMNDEITSALKANGKCVECNSHFFTTKKTSEKFRNQYAEFLRSLFEMGIPITYGSDSHHNYGDLRERVENYLGKAGFVNGDFTEISDALMFKR